MENYTSEFNCTNYTLYLKILFREMVEKIGDILPSLFESIILRWKLPNLRAAYEIQSAEIITITYSSVANESNIISTCIDQMCRISNHVQKYNHMNHFDIVFSSM